MDFNSHHIIIMIPEIGIHLPKQVLRYPKVGTCDLDTVGRGRLDKRTRGKGNANVSFFLVQKGGKEGVLTVVLSSNERERVFHGFKVSLRPLLLSSDSLEAYRVGVKG